MPNHYRIYLNNEHTNAHTDYDEVYTLWMSCTGMALNNIDDSREGIEKFLASNLETCFVAETEKKYQASYWRETTSAGNMTEAPAAAIYRDLQKRIFAL